MAWQTDNFLLAAGATTRIRLSWGGAYMGAQYATAVPNFTYTEDQIIVQDYATVRKVSDHSYWLTVFNPGGTGAVGVWFTIVGGGVS